MTTTNPTGPLRRARHALEYASVAWVAWLMRLMPRLLALGLGAGFGQLAWVLRVRRELVLANLRQAFPELGEAEHRRIGVRAARNFGRTGAEFLRFAGRDRERISELIDFAGLDELRAAVAEGKGVLIVTGHLGAWALYVTALAAAGIPAALLVGVQRNRRINDLILGIPGDAVRFIGKGKSSPRELIGALREGRVVVMVADHYSSDQQVLVPFLGREAYTLPLPGALVAKYKLPLFSMVGHRMTQGRHQIQLDRVELSKSASRQRSEAKGASCAALPGPRGKGLDALRLEVALRVNQCLGEAVREFPEQYFWYHDRWKQRQKPYGPRLRASVPDAPTVPAQQGAVSY